MAQLQIQIQNPVRTRRGMGGWGVQDPAPPPPTISSFRRGWVGMPGPRAPLEAKMDMVGIADGSPEIWIWWNTAWMGGKVGGCGGEGRERGRERAF